MYGLKPVPFKLKPVPFKLKPVPFKLKPVPFKLKPVPFKGRDTQDYFNKLLGLIATLHVPSDADSARSEYPGQRCASHRPRCAPAPRRNF